MKTEFSPWSVRKSTGFWATRIFRPFSEISLASSSSGVMSVPDGIRVEMSIPLVVSVMINQCVLVTGAHVSFDLALLFICYLHVHDWVFSSVVLKVFGKPADCDVI